MKIEEESSLVRKELRKLVFKQLNTKGTLDIITNSKNKNLIIIKKNEDFDHNNFCYINSDNSEEDTAPWNLKNLKTYEEAKELSKKVKNLKDEENLHKEQALFMKEYGFTEIIDTITASKKPLIGHNCFFDMVYFFRQFIGPLPGSFKEFKEQWIEEFPETYDTKHLSCKISTSSFTSSALGTVYKACVDSLKFKGILRIKYHENFERYKKRNKMSWSWIRCSYDWMSICRSL